MTITLQHKNEFQQSIYQFHC